MSELYLPYYKRFKRLAKLESERAVKAELESMARHPIVFKALREIA